MLEIKSQVHAVAIQVEVYRLMKMRRAWSRWAVCYLHKALVLHSAQFRGFESRSDLILLNYNRLTLTRYSEIGSGECIWRSFEKRNLKGGNEQ